MTWERFDCSLERNTVTINSANTLGLTIELGSCDNGRSLNLTGKVKIILNGKQFYKGAAQTVSL